MCFWWHVRSHWDRRWKRIRSPQVKQQQSLICKNSVPSWQYCWEHHSGSTHNYPPSSWPSIMTSDSFSESCSRLQHTSFLQACKSRWASFFRRGPQHRKPWPGLDILFWRCPQKSAVGSAKSTGRFCGSQRHPLWRFHVRENFHNRLVLLEVCGHLSASLQSPGRRKFCQ